MNNARVIYKYPLELSARQVIQMPVDCDLLTVQSQGGVITLWAAVTPESPPEDVVIKIVGTGYREVDPQDQYLGTVQISEMVWHVYVTV